MLSSDWILKKEPLSEDENPLLLMVSEDTIVNLNMNFNFVRF